MTENGERDAPETRSASDSSGREEGRRPISRDEIVSAVANEHRRAVLTSLIDASGRTLEYDALVECVANELRGDTPEAVSDEHRRRVRAALHHNHLPKLEGARMIDYEGSAGPVRFVGGGLGQEVLRLVEPTADV